jgi:hypothetical protein
VSQEISLNVFLRNKLMLVSSSQGHRFNKRGGLSFDDARTRRRVNSHMVQKRFRFGSDFAVSMTEPDGAFGLQRQ